MKSETVLIIFHECVGNGAEMNSEATHHGRISCHYPISMKMTCVLSREESQLWAIMDWSIWNARSNRVIHIGEQTNS